MEIKTPAGEKTISRRRPFFYRRAALSYRSPDGRGAEGAYELYGSSYCRLFSILETVYS